MNITGRRPEDDAVATDKSRDAERAPTREDINSNHEADQNPAAMDAQSAPQACGASDVHPAEVVHSARDTSSSANPSKVDDCDALRRQRKSLPFLPRTSQYERHPLLQTRSTATGLSEFELLMLEKDLLVRRKSVEAAAAGRTVDNTSSARRPTLVPRGAHYEAHPLFVRSDSGVCELEAYLSEISQTTPSSRKSSSAATTDDHEPTRPRKLEPRTSQCERHALLEIKDESGLTELDRLLLEKADGHETSRSRSRRCTVCGVESAARCNCPRPATGSRSSRKSVDSSVVPGSSSETTSDSKSSTAQQKRVRFVQQRQKTDPELQAAAVAAAVASDAADSNKSGRDATDSKRSKSSGKCGGRARSTAGSGAASPAAASQRKSCCVS